MKKRALAGFLVLSLGLGLFATGCGSEDQEVLDAEVQEVEPEVNIVEVETETETETEEVVAELPEGMAVNKLTGEYIDEELAAQRPFACMIENGEGDLPFYGLSRADIIYEALAESNITRMMGIWQDYESIDKIGTVRSCRSYYAAASKEYQAFYGHWGLSLFAAPTLATMKGYDMDGMGGSASYPEQIRDNSPSLNVFYRESGRASVHSVTVDTAKISDAIEDYGEKYGYKKNTSDNLPAHFNFANPGEIVTLDDFSTAEDAIVVVPGGLTDKKRYFVYDESTGLYTAYQQGSKQMDQCYGDPITCTNIIIQDCDYSIYSGIDADYDSHKYKNIQISGSGTGYYVTQGKAIAINWEKEQGDMDGEITHYYNEDGEEIKVNVGTTWIAITLPDYDSYSSRPTKFYASESDYN